MTINSENGCLSKDEVERMVSNAKKYRALDDGARRRAEAQNALEDYLYSLQSTLRDSKVRLVSHQELRMRLSVCDGCRNSVNVAIV